MNKEGQFYLVTIIIIISIFVGFITIANSARFEKHTSFFEIEEELKIERQNVLNYIISSELTPVEINNTFTDFSNQYISRIGNKKNSVFIFGNINSITLNGNKVGDINIKYNCGIGEIEIIPNGTFFNNCAGSIENVIVFLDENEYTFHIYPGQNFYYLVNYIKDKERLNIYG